MTETTSNPIPPKPAITDFPVIRAHDLYPGDVHAATIHPGDTLIVATLRGNMLLTVTDTDPDQGTITVTRRDREPHLTHVAGVPVARRRDLDTLAVENTTLSEAVTLHPLARGAYFHPAGSDRMRLVPVDVIAAAVRDAHVTMAESSRPAPVFSQVGAGKTGATCVVDPEDGHYEFAGLTPGATYALASQGDQRHEAAIEHPVGVSLPGSVSGMGSPAGFIRTQEHDCADQTPASTTDEHTEKETSPSVPAAVLATTSILIEELIEQGYSTDLLAIHLASQQGRLITDNPDLAAKAVEFGLATARPHDTCELHAGVREAMDVMFDPDTIAGTTR